MHYTLAIDFGSKNIGVALVDHTGETPNRVLYAATVVADPKWLQEFVKPRVQARRIRRTRKTHKRRLKRLAEALDGISGAGEIVRFCRRRGYSYEPKDTEDATKAFHVPREEFFVALRKEVGRVIAPQDRDTVLKACSRHLNESRHREAELRPARFENRGPTQCDWQGCHRNVPRAHNAYRERFQQALYAWLKPVFDESPDPERLRRSVDHWIAELDALARWRRKTETLDAAAAKTERQKIDKRKRKVYKSIRDRIRGEASDTLAEVFAENWRKTYSKNLTDIASGKQGGRICYCGRHSDLFVDYFLAGKAIPHRTDVTESDLVSRRQQIVFAKLWGLVRSRLLPLAGGQIDRVVVERVAFDMLAGKAKARREMSEDRAAEMYWHGPQYGFLTRLEMLQEEFAGRCAYCGQPGAVQEVEHLLPRSQFPFDSYFNILPSCRGCNAQKGSRTAHAARMKIHPDAYEAYSQYVDRMKVPHLFHTVKKGMLNLMTRDGKAAEAEKMLGMLANNLVTISNTQRGPRLLARYLAGKIRQVTKTKCEAAYVAGRHTALYRSIVLPEYDKPAEKAEGGLTNHAVDAVILGCQLPSAAALENPQWYSRARDVNAWREKVAEAAPPLEDGLPRVEPIPLIQHFETDLGNGYCAIDLSAFNWNRSRKATHKLDPVGMTRDGRPAKRRPAGQVLAALQKNAGSRDKQIELIAHRALRNDLLADPSEAPKRFVEWLQQTVRSGLSQQTMGDHPSDQARKKQLEEFVNTPVEKFLGDGDDSSGIPPTIGIRCLVQSSRVTFDTARCDKSGRTFQHYLSTPRVRALYVGYRLRGGELDRTRPIVLCVNQMYAVARRQGGREEPVEVAEGSPLRGRSLGSKGPLKDFLAEWHKAFSEVCREEGIVKRFQLTQGCVIEKMDGTRFQMRNFDTNKPWMKPSSLRDIHRVYRSPFRFLGCGEDAG